ncbi:glutathione S-transferase A4-like isoform X3 [Diceros bicornis minor]|uniref:glutathione S-transferase A4-like isoform X3 n=1 Tax=Diceros bicornis minor TaxID=77932 RepID=UPI0026F1D665|nr:glutathione S-transferase A4-like isoform X3 [Diceros bicornis minor]
MAAANVPVPGGVSPLAEMHSEPIRNPEPGVMAAKPKLYYFRGRGRMEPIRWLLAAAGVEFEEEFLETRERYEKLQKDGHLLFGQVPLVEIDGMMLTQTTAILSYLAAKEGPEGESQILKDHGEDFLVGNKFSWADIQLLEAVLMVEELSASVLSDFPLLKLLPDDSAPLNPSDAKAPSKSLDCSELLLGWRCLFPPEMPIFRPLCL